MLLGAGAVAAWASFRDGGLPAEVVNGDVPINPSALDRLDRTANNSPTITANPRDPANLAVVNRIDSPDFGCALQVSFDGGSRWMSPALPPPPEPNARCLAPDAAFDPDGTLYIAFSSFATLPGAGPDPVAIYLVSSADGGRTLSAPRRAGGPLAFGVRLISDHAVPRRLYLCWVQATETSGAGFATDGNPILAARSDDGGLSWRSPVRVSAAGRRRVIGPTIVGGSGDAIHVAYLDVGDDRLDYNGLHLGRGGEPYSGPWSLVVATSRDSGASWQDAVAEPRLIPTSRFIDLLAPTPALAADRGSGRLYAAFQDGRLGDADVYLWISSDGGRTWSPAGRVNDTPPRDGTSQHLPALQVAPDGRLDILYYDARSDPRDVRTEVSFQSSFDAGRTFAHRLVVSEVAFDSRVGFGYERGLPELGSRLALISTDARVLALWSDARGGTLATHKQDIAKAIISVPEGGVPRSPLRYGGFAAAVIGAILVAESLVRRPRRPEAAGPG